MHVVAGRSCRLNSGKVVNTGRSGVGSMNVDTPAPTADGGSAAHIRGAEGTIIVAFGRVADVHEVVTRFRQRHFNRV